MNPLLLVVTAALAAGPEVRVRYLTNVNKTLTAFEHLRGTPEVQLAATPQPCAIARAAWAATADQVLVSSDCQLVRLDLAAHTAEVLPRPPRSGTVELEFAKNGALIAFAAGRDSKVRAFEWKAGAWALLETGEPTDGLDSLDSILFLKLKTRERLFERPTGLSALVLPGEAKEESERPPTADEQAALPAAPEGHTWMVLGDGAWAGTQRATDACFLDAPIAVRVGRKWKVVVPGEGNCVRAQRLGGALLLAHQKGTAVISLPTGKADELPAHAIETVLVGPGTSFTK